MVLADTGDDDAQQVNALALWIDDRALGEVSKAENDEWTLSDAQTEALIAALKAAPEWSFAVRPSRLSSPATGPLPRC